MKKLLCIVALSLCTSLSSFAQFFGGGGFFCYDCYGSIEMGANLSSISGLENSEAKTGFYIGFYQFNEVSDVLALRYGTSYNNLGAKVKGYEQPLVIHSINTPLSLHYIHDYKFQAFAGGELGTNFFGKLPAYESTDTFDHSFEFHDTLTLFDVSVFVGGGIILFETLDINLRYNLGVTDISKDLEQDWKKNWLTLSMGYTFR